MRAFLWSLIVLFLAGCQAGLQSPPGPELVEPATFSHWPGVTKAPIPVGGALWGLCRALTPEEVQEQNAAAKAHGPHVAHAVVVRVSPDAVASFREGKPLPTGAMVVKEKYSDGLALGPLQEYAIMIKRQPGYDSDGGDWEYAYVTLVPARSVVRGRLGACADCHSNANDRDYLFRPYLGAGE